MVEYPAKIISAAALSILCIGAALAAPASPPLFSPNPNVGWISLGGDYLPPKSGAGPVGQDPRFPRVSNEEFRRTGRQPTIAMADLNAPILQPWTREALRKQRALVQSGKGGTSPQANCWPTGPAFVLHVIHPIFLVQGPKEVLMVWQGDHQVRHVYLTDKHSQNIKPSWFGESIGHYEGDALVVDTIGFNTKTYIDGFYTPHTERLHMIERFRMIEGGKVMEVGVHVEDPGAFTAPWNAIHRWRRVEPGVAENDVPISAVSSSADAGPLHEMSCAENPFSYFGAESLEIPHADKADF